MLYYIHNTSLMHRKPLLIPCTNMKTPKDDEALHAAHVLCIKQDDHETESITVKKVDH